MRDFNENTATAAVLERMSAAKDARFKEIMTSVVTHLHQPEMNLGGLFTTGPDGRFFFSTVKPSSYPIPTDGPVGKMLIAMGRHPMRPAHIHFIVGAPGFEPVTTHVFVDGDAYLDSDAVFGVKDSLIEPFVLKDDPAEAAKLGLGNPYYVARHEFALVRQNAES
jgi:catechol 1,2-dioxygenase